MNSSLRVWTRAPYPLGATWMGDGVNFALFSEHATRVDLCLFDGDRETDRIPLPDRQNQVWHGFFPDLRPGQLYGFRVEGPYQPRAGHRFNPHKLLLDPYAKAVAGRLQWNDAVFGFRVGAPEEDLSFDDRDSAPFVPKGVVIDGAFDWEETERPRHPRHESVVYEVHVRGFSKLWNAVPEELRGTYGGLACPEAIVYFHRLGVTAVELLPVHQYADEHYLVQRGLTNYWGYNTLGFFAPHALYSSRGDRGGQVTEFKEMVKALHRAGIEVILDVVYNHTAEGNQTGPTLSFRGVDNAAYYRLRQDDPRYYTDYTGCGNTPNVPHPAVLQMVMDSLRYWVTEMRVDGFRFDLAPALAREPHEVSRLSAFFDVIHQDPVISQVKLIAEPWDVGEGGYQVGNFPYLWSEWNGKYRDCIRQFWKGDSVSPRELAHRLGGSPDLYELDGKAPSASVNFVTAHDGFTLRDLVSYDAKHNLDNGEENRDGDNGATSWNCGAEGPTADPAINALRRRQQRNFLATLLLSQGMPMLTAGDEYGRTQNGNNNAYCQDTPLSWLAWERDGEAERLTRFVTRLIVLRRDHPVFRRPKFFLGQQADPEGWKDLTWFDAGGREMTEEMWADFQNRGLGMLLCGDTLDVRDYQGNPIRDETFLVAFNGHADPVAHVLPGGPSVIWERLLDTAEEEGFLDQPTRHAPGVGVRLEGRSILVLRQAAGSDVEAKRPPAIVPGA